MSILNDIDPLEGEQAIPQVASWVRSHFFEDSDGDNRSRWRCSAIGCEKSYSKTVSHNCLKQHYKLEHNMLSPRKRQFTFHDEIHVDLFIKHIIMDRVSYTEADSPYFRRFINSFGLKKTMICRQTLSRTISERKGDLEKEVQAKLSTITTIGLTFDIWSARKRTRGFGVVTGHYVDESYTLRSVMLEFEYIPYPHSAEVIYTFLTNVIDKYDLRKKVIAITTDNASNNISALNNLEEDLSTDIFNLYNHKFVHVRCIAHVINLAVKEALKLLKEVIDPIKDAVLIIRSSTKRNETFLKVQQAMLNSGEDSLPNRQPLNLKEPVETRWNSTFLMIERAYMLRYALIRVSDIISELIVIKNLDWERVRDLVEFLRPFHDVTERLSGEKYPTMSLVTSTIPALFKHVDQRVFLNATLELAAYEMKSKLEYYQELADQPLIALCTILDPRIKMSFVPTDVEPILKDFLRKCSSNIGQEVESVDDSINSQTINLPGRSSIFDDIFVADESRD